MPTISGFSYFYAYLNDHGRAGFVMASSATDSANKDRDIREKLVLTGDVDVMVSVGNNFFYTLSLPCSLWFFDKAKRLENKDRVLFIDARNYFTVVDRTLNEWTEWQLKNLQAIVHLYRGEQEKYVRLTADYQKEIRSMAAEVRNRGEEFSNAVDEDTRGHFFGLMGWITDAVKDKFDVEDLKTRLNNQIDQTKQCMKCSASAIKKREVKAMRTAGEAFIAYLNEIQTVISEYEWLTSKFGLDGTYEDVPGLCKIATIDEIAEKNYSLTPGAYVGVAEVEDDGVDFHERMNEIHAELKKLNSEANELMGEIMKEWDNLKTK